MEVNQLFYFDILFYLNQPKPLPKNFFILWTQEYLHPHEGAAKSIPGLIIYDQDQNFLEWNWILGKISTKHQTIIKRIIAEVKPFKNLNHNFNNYNFNLSFYLNSGIFNIRLKSDQPIPENLIKPIIFLFVNRVKSVFAFKNPFSSYIELSESSCNNRFKGDK